MVYEFLLSSDLAATRAPLSCSGSLREAEDCATGSLGNCQIRIRSTAGASSGEAAAVKYCMLVLVCKSKKCCVHSQHRRS